MEGKRSHYKSNFLHNSSNLEFRTLTTKQTCNIAHAFTVMHHFNSKMRMHIVYIILVSNIHTSMTASNAMQIIQAIIIHNICIV